MRRILVQLLLLAIFVFLTIFASLKYNTYGKIEQEIELQEKNELLLESGDMSLEIFQSLIKKELNSRKKLDLNNEPKESASPKIDFSGFKIKDFNEDKGTYKREDFDRTKSDFIDFSKRLFEDTKGKFFNLLNSSIFQKTEEN